ncbi:MAG TPA: RHS repeat-associated core domain-containing protein [Blastocatellia bacterium]|nr:RHS repeat-associated core domain-containing protein [Blastocatellia bacterium]
MPALSARSAGEFAIDVLSWPIRLLRRKTPRPVKLVSVQETPADRAGHVSSLQISPPKRVGYQGERIPITTLPLDAAGRPVEGVLVSFSSSDTTMLTLDPLNIATLLQPGVVWVNASAGSATARVPVLVLPGSRALQSDAQWAADQALLNPDGSVNTGVGSVIPSLLDKLVPTVHAQSGGGDSADFAYDELWSDPRNRVGTPPGRVAEHTNIGEVMPESSNFRLAIPFESLPGRGLTVNVAGYYNSRGLWSRHGNAVTFNAINTWPYPGFSISFGRIVTYGSDPNTKLILVDSDGTRHYLGSGVGYQTKTYQTNDGTHITYVGNATTGGTIHYNNGTSMAVGLINNRLLVSTVIDTNGSSYSISYQGLGNPACQNGLGFQWHQAINYIYDSLGRTIVFNYDSCNNLVGITAPGLGGTSQNPVSVTLAQLDYTGLTPSTSFSGLTVENASGYIPVLSHIYFPTTQTGYEFQYSAYGMVYQVSQRRQMSIDQNGVISDGLENNHASFNYPLTASSLTDAPAFTQRTESPGSANPFVYSTLAPNTVGPNTLTFVVTPPDASTNASYPVQYLTRSTDSTNPANGLLVQGEIKNYSGTSFGKTVMVYANDPGGSPQVQSVLTYDDTGTSTQVNYDCDQYGNLTNMREFGYQVNGVWDVRRRTHYTYVTDSNYVNKYMRSLVSEKDTYDALLDNNDANDVLIAKSTYQYDNYALMGNMENYGGNYSGGSAPPGYNTTYNDQTLTIRGNLTGSSDYTDVVNQISETYNSKIDIFGNMAQQQVPCCNLNTYTFTVDTYWSTPDQTIKGDPSGVHLTKLLTHDFNTSLTTQETDPNNLSTSFSYDNSGRPTQVTPPTGATGAATYNDGTMSPSSSASYMSGGSQITVTTSYTYDGWGRTTQSINPSNGQVNTTYDALGRVISRTNPFQAGGAPGPATTYHYDPLGRATVVTLPDGNTVQTSYSGATLTETDQVGRKMQYQRDGLGRMTTATEQDSSGNLTQSTSYAYDLLNNLTQVNQGGQTRAFKYDALSRKLYDRMPEQSATINDGTGTMWSSKYTYTTFNAISTRQDARGAVTTWGYDSLNRLTSLSYDISQAPGVASANNVSYTYDTSTTNNTKGLLLSISMTGALPSYNESLSYDSFNRVSSRTISMDGQNYTVQYQDNQIGQGTQTTYPDGRVVATSYDSSGRLSSITEPVNSQTGAGGTYLSRLSYNYAQQATGDTLSSGIAEAFGYDSQRLQLTSQTATAPGGQTGGLMNLNYSYQSSAGQMGANTTAGNAGQLMAVNNSSTINGTAESAAYTYDLQHRLVTSSQTTNGVSAQRRFAYDRWGNRTGMWDATSGGNQIQSIALQQSGGAPTNQIQSVTAGSTLNYTYDSAGNVTSDGVHSYQYDAENRIKSVDSAATGSYRYDYQNRRIKRSTSSIAIHYIWDGNQVLGEHNMNTGAQIVDYVYAGSKLIAEGPGNQLGGNGSMTFLLGDRLSTRLSVSTSGVVLGRQATLPFGEEFGESGTQEKHHFTSFESDSETGTDYAVNREHSQAAGRFLAVDPLAGSIANPQSLNRYSYSANDPVNLVDPRGMGFECFNCVGEIDPESITVYCACVYIPDEVNCGNKTSIDKALKDLDTALNDRSKSPILNGLKSIQATVLLAAGAVGGKLQNDGKELASDLGDDITSIFNNFFPIGDTDPAILDTTEALVGRLKDWLAKARPRLAARGRSYSGDLNDIGTKGLNQLSSIQQGLNAVGQCTLDDDQFQKWNNLYDRWESLNQLAGSLFSAVLNLPVA